MSERDSSQLEDELQAAILEMERQFPNGAPRVAQGINVVRIDNERSVLVLGQALVAASLLGGELTTPSPEPSFRWIPQKDRCPNCARGKLVGSHGLRYCQRCSYTMRMHGK